MLLPDSIELGNFLDFGGQGVVYAGAVEDKAAAIKIYFPGQTHKRIQREIDALSAMNCPSVVGLLATAQIPYKKAELQVVATTLVNGIALDAFLNERGLSYHELSILAYDGALAIEKMWERRIVHRDLKPSNIMMAESGRFVVIDLGLARHIELSSLTAIGVTWGTLGYMSPEQSKAARQLTCKSDIYALGVVLLESALAKHPTNGNQEELFDNQFHNNLPDEIEEWKFASLLSEMLHPRPTKRPLPGAILSTLEAHKR